jgi:hypothetical protein
MCQSIVVHHSVLTVSCSKTSHVVTFPLQKSSRESRHNVRLHVPCLSCHVLFLNLSFLSYIFLYTLFSFSICYLLPSLSFLLLTFHLTLTRSLSFALLPYPQLLFLLPLSLFPAYFIFPIIASCFTLLYSVLFFCKQVMNQTFSN